MQNHMNSDPAALEREAKKAGFNSAAEMQNFYANRARMRKRGGSTPQSTPAPSSGKAPPPKKKSAGKGPLERLLNAFGN